MATVTLDRLWLNLADDPSEYRALRVGTFTPALEAPGEFRRLANGRVRLIRRAGQARTMTAELVAPPLTDLQWLWLHNGEPMTVRDPDGGKFHGAYLLTEYDRPVGYDANVSLSLTEVTASEAV